MHRLVRSIASMHAQPFQAQPMVFRKCADAHERRRDRYLISLCKSQKFLVRIGMDDSAANEQTRPAALLQHRPQRLDIFRLRQTFRHRLVQRRLWRRHGIAGRLLDIPWNVDDNWPRPPVFRQIKRFRKHLRQFQRIEHKIAVLHAEPCHADDVRLLEGVFPNQMLVHLPRDDDHRHGIRAGVRNAGHEIRRARPAGRHADADFACLPRISARRERAALLMPRQYDTHACIMQRMVQRHRRGTRIREHKRNPRFQQAVRHDLRASHAGAVLLFFLLHICQMVFIACIPSLL